MLVGIASLIGSTTLFMEAPAYYVMVIARALQGISSAVVWTVGMALLYVTVLNSIRFDSYIESA